MTTRRNWPSVTHSWLPKRNNQVEQHLLPPYLLCSQEDKENLGAFNFIMFYLHLLRLRQQTLFAKELLLKKSFVNISKINFTYLSSFEAINQKNTKYFQSLITKGDQATVKIPIKCNLFQLSTKKQRSANTIVSCKNKL